MNDIYYSTFEGTFTKEALEAINGKEVYTNIGGEFRYENLRGYVGNFNWLNTTEAISKMNENYGYIYVIESKLLIEFPPLNKIILNKVINRAFPSAKLTYIPYMESKNTWYPYYRLFMEYNGKTYIINKEIMNDIDLGDYIKIYSITNITDGETKRLPKNLNLIGTITDAQIEMLKECL